METSEGNMPGFRGWVILIWVASVPLLVTAFEAKAETVDDSGLWLAMFARGDIQQDSCCSGFKWWFDGHTRFFEDADGFGQSIVRPGIGYAMNKRITMWAGYGWIHTSPERTADFDEHRTWQQITWSSPMAKGSLGLRSRLEQRFLDTGSETGWRFRQLASYRQPFCCSPRLTLVAWDELFIHLNDTNYGADGGFDQNRLFLGCGIKYDPCNRWRVEVGYLNQYVDRFGRDDTRNHILSFNLYRSP